MKKSTVPDKEKDKWAKVLIADVMSSEERDSDNEEILLIKPLPWRADKVTQFFQQLDEKIEQSKKAQAKRQRKRRVLSNALSTCSKPITALPVWSVVES